MSAPVTLYSPDGKRTREIAAIDVPGWIQAGWSKSPVVVVATPAEVAPDPEPSPEPESSSAAQTQTKSKRNDLPRDGVPEN